MLSLMLRRSLWTLCLLLAWPSQLRAGDAIYFSLQAIGPLPHSPSSLLVQSPTFINVPAGSVLSVHLLRGDNLIATSTLSFSAAYTNEALIPSVPIASFIPTGESSTPGQPLPGATLVAGQANLVELAADVGKYRLLWTLSSGVMGTPGRAVLTGAPPSFLDMKLTEVSAAARLGDQKPGSVLFYNLYTSSPTNRAREDTLITLTNTNPAETASVKLFLVSGSNCQTLRLEACLQPRQTLSFLASDIDPGVRGYIVVVAVDSAGQPTQFNWLTGNAQVKLPSPLSGLPYDAVLSAVAIAKRSSGSVPNNGGVAEMIFNDSEYDRLPAHVVAEHVPSQFGNTNATTLMLYRPLANLAGGAVSGTIQVSADNDQGSRGSGSVSFSCYSQINVPLLQMQPPLNQFLPSGTSAWFNLSTADSLPLLAAQLNAGRFSSGSTLRPLTFTADYRISMPISASACPGGGAQELRISAEEQESSLTAPHRANRPSSRTSVKDDGGSSLPRRKP